MANLLLFVVFLVGMTATGYRVHNNEQLDHGQPAESVGSYLTSGNFFEATFENWESEFLQMGMYVCYGLSVPAGVFGVEADGRGASAGRGPTDQGERA